MKKFWKLIKSKTPKVGKRIAKIGLGVGAVGVTMEFNQPDMIELIPENQRIYFIIAKWIFIIIGTAMAGGGMASTIADPDEIVKEK